MQPYPSTLRAQKYTTIAMAFHWIIAALIVWCFALGWIKTVTGSLAIGLSAIAALVVLGGLAVLIGVPARTLREHAQKTT